MRNFVFLILMLLVATNSSAQKFEFGLNGGVFNRQSSSISYDHWSVYHTEHILPGNNTILSASVMYNYKKWQAGISADYFSFIYYNFARSVWGVSGGYTYNATITEIVVPVKIFLSRKIVFSKLEAYGGLHCGYVIVANRKEEISVIFASGINPHKYGFTTGLNIGATYFINKKIGADIQLGADYIPVALGHAPDNIDYASNKGKYTVLQFPLTLGIRYKL
jgi:hypothetical protein